MPCGGVGQWAWHLVLPWMTFALFFVALYMRIVRARMLEVLEEPFVRTARAKGASELHVIRAHALRNAIAPVVTMVAMDAGMAIGIAMYIETVFALPGLGRTLIRALAGLQGYDLPVILAVTLVAAAAIIVLNLVADLVLLALDPTVARGLAARAVPARGTLRRADPASSPRCTRGRTIPTSARSSRSWSDALRARGHEIELAVLDRRAGGKRRFLELRRRVRARRGRMSSGRTSSSRRGCSRVEGRRAARRHRARPRRAQHRLDPRRRARSPAASSAARRR